MDSPTTKRVGLKVIQTSAVSDSIIVGNDRPAVEVNKKRKLSGVTSHKKRKRLSSFNVYTDTVLARVSKPTVECVDKSTNTDDSYEITETCISSSDLTEEEPGIEYWKELAEVRRDALHCTLAENEQLHKQNSQLKKRHSEDAKTIAELNKDAKKYEELAENAELLANTLNNIIGG